VKQKVAPANPLEHFGSTFNPSLSVMAALALATLAALLATLTRLVRLILLPALVATLAFLLDHFSAWSWRYVRQ
jgi:hypothetical protein